MQDQRATEKLAWDDVKLFLALCRHRTLGGAAQALKVDASTVSRRLALTVMRAVGHSYPRLLLGLIISNFLLTPIVPSGIARVVIMAAIALGLADAGRISRQQVKPRQEWIEPLLPDFNVGGIHDLTRQPKHL